MLVNALMWLSRFLLSSNCLLNVQLWKWIFTKLLLLKEKRSQGNGSSSGYMKRWFLFLWRQTLTVRVDRKWKVVREWRVSELRSAVSRTLERAGKSFVFVSECPFVLLSDICHIHFLLSWFFTAVTTQQTALHHFENYYHCLNIRSNNSIFDKLHSNTHTEHLTLTSTKLLSITYSFTHHSVHLTCITLYQFFFHPWRT